MVADGSGLAGNRENTWCTLCREGGVENDLTAAKIQGVFLTQPAPSGVMMWPGSHMLRPEPLYVHPLLNLLNIVHYTQYCIIGRIEYSRAGAGYRRSQHKSGSE